MGGRETKVLVVEDDAATAAFLADNLRADGYRVASRRRRGEGLRAIEVRRPDLVLLDLMLDDGHGLEVLDRVRAADGLASRIDPDLPVIVLSGRGGEIDRVRGFARGCDDYVGEAVLLPRAASRACRAVLRRAADRSRRGRPARRRAGRSTRSRAACGSTASRSTCRRRSSRCCTRSRPSRRAVFPKEELLRDVWGYVAMGNTRTVDAHACRLRKKLAGSARPYVLNLRGVGYRLTEAL